MPREVCSNYMRKRNAHHLLAESMCHPVGKHSVLAKYWLTVLSGLFYLYNRTIVSENMLKRMNASGVSQHTFLFLLYNECHGQPIVVLCDDAAAKSLQSCLTLRDPMDCSLPGSSVHGILQTRVLEWGDRDIKSKLFSKSKNAVYKVVSKGKSLSKISPCTH